MKFVTTARLALAFALATVSSGAQAQEYPSKMITVTIGLAAGSGADVLVRHFTTKLSELAGQPVVVQNKVGAFNSIAAQSVATAKPDGYTVLFSGSAILAGGKHLVKDLPFEGTKDFVPVAVFAESPFLLCVGPNSPYKTVEELLAGMKAKPRNIFGYTSPTAFVSTMYFVGATQIHADPVSYKNAADALPDVTNGTLDFAIFDSAFVAGQIKNGRLRALAATGAKRIAMLSDVPTMQEAGVANYNFSPWWGAFVPVGTPPAIVAKLGAWIKQIAESPDTVKFVESIANVPLAGGPADAAELLKSDTAKWDMVAKTANLQPQ